MLCVGLLLVLSLVGNAHGFVEACTELSDEYTAQKQDKFSDLASLIPRYVQSSGNDTEACLNYQNITQPPPCNTLYYSLNGDNSSSTNHSNDDVAIYLGPGTHKLFSATAVIDSRRVAIIGSGEGRTFMNCGSYLADKVCQFKNFQVRNSTFVFITGITFTRCGPITSIVYIAFSNHVYIESCSFLDNLSPPLLLHNTPTVTFNNVTFTNNHPEKLENETALHKCYFSGGRDVFFIDNRTTSGAISFYIEDFSTRFLIINSTFFNNSARPDDDVTIPRLSSSYGHGGAVNIRLLKSHSSRVCISNSVFRDNYADAHAGALAISLAGLSTANEFFIGNSIFDGNYCKIDKCTGGAVGIDFFSDTRVNTILFVKTNFTRNRAVSSGAISLSTFVSARYEDGVSDSLKLDECIFEENEAFFEGTAFGAFSLTNANQIGVPIEVRNCRFDNNVASRGSTDTTAVTAYRVLITFYGINTFNNNFGGGLSLLSSRMDVRGNLTFNNNTAVFGGGIAMSGRSLILLYEDSSLHLINNKVSEVGAGIYVEFASSDFVLSVLNTGCFMRYYSNQVGIPPAQWKTRVSFINNTARLAGAAIYANDMSRCRWIGGLNFTDINIFQIPEVAGSPFHLENNTISRDVAESTSVRNQSLATDADNLITNTTFSSDSTVSYGERVSISLTSLDQLGNFRESVWSVNAPLEQQPLGSLSSNDSTFVYDVPSQQLLTESTEVTFRNNSANISAQFTFLQNQLVTYPVNLTISGCHPGYKQDNTSSQCVCDDQPGVNQQDNKQQVIIRCDTASRYFYVQDGLWIGVREDKSLIYSNTIPGFLNCTRQGSLQGCLFKYDEPEEQCADGRTGKLCGECLDGYGPSFDLRFCSNECVPGGVILFIFICIITMIGSLLVLYFDFPIPNELKGVIFFTQVIGVVYRNTPYYGENSASVVFFDFLLNILGYAMPFPICLWPDNRIPAYGMAFLGFVPPAIALITATVYICFAKRSRRLSQRENYGFHGFYFLFLFVYKYILDASFNFISCTQLDGEYVFSYQGTVSCFEAPFVVFFIIGIVLVIGLGIVLPAYTIYIIYQPEKTIQISNALTHGLKQRKRYLWYGVWDIWRRLLFIVANLFLSVSTSSTVLFIDCVFIMVCLIVICLVQPYKKYHINFMESLIILCLFGATLAILDSEDIYVGPIASASFISFPYLYAVVFIGYRGINKFGSMGWNKANAKWNLLERNNVRKLIECYESVKKYFSEKKQKVASAFIYPFQEADSQNQRDSGYNSNTKDSIQSNSSSASNEKPVTPTTFQEICDLREPLLD